MAVNAAVDVDRAMVGKAGEKVKRRCRIAGIARWNIAPVSAVEQ
jgi:hypothetical protein